MIVSRFGNLMRSAAAVILILFSCLTGYAQGNSSKGTDFWTAFMANTNPPGTPTGSQMVLYVTSDVNTTVAVAANGYGATSYQVTAKQVTTITVDPGLYLPAAGKSSKGIHITSLDPVAVYAHIFADESSGATLLLPVSALGKNYESINYAQASDVTPSYSAFLVVATEDTTTVEITENTVALSGATTTKTEIVSMKKGDVYQVLSAVDLTGSRIRSISTNGSSCKKIAVFSGSTRIAIGCNVGLISSDNLFQQTYPTSTWGRNYITVPLKSRQYDVFRVVLSDPNTNLTVGGQAIAPSSFVAGLFYEFQTQQPTIISADKAIQVVQYAVTEGNTLNCKDDVADLGDPEMIYLNPLEQTLDHITLYSASKFKILSNYINVVIPTSVVASFLLDGSHPGGFNLVPDNDLYCFAALHVQSGPHVLSAAGGFDAIAYGFGDHESYGYSAGASLQDLNSFIALQNPESKVNQNSGCAGVNYNMQLSLPYQTNSIKWDLGDGHAFTQTNPTVAGTTTNGAQTLYIYNYPKNPVNYKQGNYTAIATVFNPVADDCGSDQQVELDFEISEPPVADFKVDAAPGYGTAFIDESTSTAEIKTWVWDFGDGQTSVDQNPLHNYAKPGNYKVTLTVSDVDGCSSSSTEIVRVNIVATAAVGSIAACKGQAAASPDIQNFTVLGGGLSVGLSLTAPPGFEISLSDTDGYAGALNLGQTGGSVNSTIIYVRSVAGAPLGNIAGDVLITSAGVNSTKVAVSGIINDLPAANPVSSETVFSSVPTKPIIFTGTSNTFSWTNDKPAIGLPASGQGNINSFKPINGGKKPVTATIVVTPLSLTSAYVANANYNNVSVISTATNFILASINVGSNPQGVAATADGSRVYVTNSRDNTVSVIDAHTNTLVVPNIKTLSDPFGICVSPDGKWVYFTSAGTGQVIVMNSSTFEQTPIKVQSKPIGVAISPDGSMLYVSNSGTNNVSVINTATNSVSSTLTVGTKPDGLLLSPDGTKLYVVNTGSASVTVFNTVTAALITTIKVGFEPFGITQNPDGSRVYVTNSQSNSVSVIDGVANNVITEVPVGAVPFGISVNPDGSVVYVANQFSNDISVIDTKTNKEINRFDSNPGPTSFGNFIISGTGCTGLPIKFTITVNPLPGEAGISYNEAPAALTAIYGNVSPAATFTVSGENLPGGISVSAPKGFAVSADNRIFSSSITIAADTNGRTVYLRLTTGIPVNTYTDKIKLTGPGATEVDVPVSGTVTPAPLMITADNKTKVYGFAIPPLTVTYSGLVNNDNASDLKAKPQVTTTATQGSPVGEYPITAADAASPNYIISYTPGELTITAVVPPISVPNTFTPNGDGINDAWNIKYIEDYPAARVMVFNRYGGKVFSSVGYAVPWDGNYKGGALPAGTYYYIIDTGGGGKLLTGFVTIIR